MCGIFGYLTDKPSMENYELLFNLLELSAMRGTDATGLAIYNAEDEEVKIFKEAIPADKFIEKYKDKLKIPIAHSKLVIGHTRAATQGSPKDNSNNHPINSPAYIMIHNGVCSSMDRIKDYPYKGEVDSEILLSYIEREGISKGLAELKGTAAVAILPIKEKNTLYLWRHNNPLWVAYDVTKKTLFFGSTEDILKEGLANLLNIFSSFQMRQLAEEYLYKVSYSPLRVDIMEEIEPKKSWTSYGTSWGGHNSYGIYDSEKWENGGRYIGNSSHYLQKDIVEEKDKSISKQLLELTWDSEYKRYIKEDKNSVKKSNKYYFEGQSQDFKTWEKLKPGCHLSSDKHLCKIYDKDKNAHFLITLKDALEEGFISLKPKSGVSGK